MIHRVRRTVKGDCCASRLLSSTGLRAIHASMFKEQSGDVTLKIGTYLVTNGNIHFDRASRSPMGGIRLNLAEVDQLISLLEQAYGPLKIGADQYIKIEDAEDAVLFERIRNRFTGQDAGAVLKLMEENELLPEHIIGAVVHRDRAKAVRQFREMLELDLPERAWQAWFERNDWVLGSSHVVVLDERDIDVENQGDYLIKSEDGFLDIIEIKKPGLRLWSGPLDHGNLIPHSDLVKAITQANNYLFQLEKKMNSIEDVKRFSCPIARPRAVLLHGRSDGWQEMQFEAQRLLNSSMSSIQVLTYDQVLARAERALIVVPTEG